MPVQLSTIEATAWLSAAGRISGASPWRVFSSAWMPLKLLERGAFALALAELVAERKNAIDESLLLGEAGLVGR